MANKISSEVWFLIAEKVAEDDWKPLFTSLPFVNRSARGGILAYLESRVLPILEKIAPVEKFLATTTRCQRLQMELERKQFYSERHWQKHIHVSIKELLRNSSFENWDRFEDLLRARADVNAFTSQHSTPLLLVCDALGDLFSERMEPDARQRRYTSILKMMKSLLQHGADPNLQGFPSTPLVTILSQQPFGSEDRTLMKELIELLIAHGADRGRIPVNDIYGTNKPPTELAAKWEFCLPAK